MSYTNKRIWFCALGAMVVIMALASCSNEIRVSSTPTPSPIAIEISATSSPSPTSTATPKPTTSPTKHPTQTPFPSPAPTVTPWPYPTLDAQAKLNYVIESLKTNRGCELPCWWGITPGKTKWEDMINSFARQGIRVGFDKSDNAKLDLLLPLGQNTNEYALDVDFQKEDDIVKSIDISNYYYDIMAQPQYADARHRYTLDQILLAFGVPSKVQMELTTFAYDWYPGLTHHYSLWILYEDRGIAIRYPGELINEVQSWYVCPTPNDTSAFEIRLNTPHNVTITQEDDFYVNLGFSGSLQALTGLSRQTFYDVFKQYPPFGCLLAADPSIKIENIDFPKTSMILPIAQEEEYLINNLNNNDDCELPCWWGIKPGETKSQNVAEMFLKLGKRVSNFDNTRQGQGHEVSLFGRHTPYPFDYVVRHRWYESANGTVSLFGVTGSTLNWSPPQYFAQDWHRYSLNEALARYGAPSKVLLHYWSFGWQYNIGLIYEKQGFLIDYTGPIIDKGVENAPAPIKICPNQNLPTTIDIWMTKPNSSYSIENAFGQLGIEAPVELTEQHIFPIESIAAMSVQEFYETFLNPNAEICLTVPRAKGSIEP